MTRIKPLFVLLVVCGVASGAQGVDSLREPAALPGMKVVETADLRCVPIDSPRQSAKVREAVIAVQVSLRARRALELRYQYEVHETGTIRAQHGGPEFRDRRFVQSPDDTAHLGEWPDSTLRANHGTAGRTLATGSLWWGWPAEDILLRPWFTSAAVCFDTTIVAVRGDERELRFRQLSGEPHMEGVIRLSRTGLIAALTEHHVDDRRANRVSMTGTIAYAEIPLDSTPVPFMARVTLDGVLPSDRRFAYSKFVRVK